MRPANPRVARTHTFDPALTQAADRFGIRLDRNLGASDCLFFRYRFDKGDKVNLGVIPSPANPGVPIAPHLSTGTNATTTPLFNHSAALSYRKVLSPATVGETRFALSVRNRL